MGKVNNALSMLALLRSRKRVSRRELAEELEVSTREISRYKVDLECAGVHIREVRGKYGGYELGSKDYLLALDLTEEEKAALNLIVAEVSTQGLPYKKEVKNAIQKINAIDQVENLSYNEFFITKGNKAKINYEEEKEKWNIINTGRIASRKILLKYKNFNGEISERVVRPYASYSYEGANYFLGFCEKRNELRQFKYMRIMNINLIEEKFEKDVSFNLKEYLKESIGIYKDETLRVRLKVKYPYAQYLKENQWVANEEIEDFYEEGYLIYKATMEGKTQIKGWILGMGASCEVLEPKSLKEEIIEECLAIINK